MTRSRCTPPPRGRNPGDPREVARRWEDLRERTRALDARPVLVRPLVADQVWERLATPTTWTTEPTPDPYTAWARVVGGHPARWQPTVASGAASVSDLLMVLAFWQGEPSLLGVPDHRNLDRVVRPAGFPPGPPPRGWDQWAGTLRKLHPADALARLGGGASEYLGAVDTRRVPRTRRDRWAVAVRWLAHGGAPPRRDTLGDFMVLPPRFRTPVRIRVSELTTSDPRLAARFLRCVPWWTWPEDEPSPRMRAVRTWLSATAGTDRAALAALVRLHRAAPGLTPTAGLVAMHLAGVPGGPDPAGRVRGPRVADFPVLWWRRILGHLLRCPDRTRAWEGILTLWARTVGSVSTGGV